MILHLTLANQELDALKGPINENSGVVKGGCEEVRRDHDATLSPPIRSRSHSNQPAVVAPPQFQTIHTPVDHRPEDSAWETGFAMLPGYSSQDLILWPEFRAIRKLSCQLRARSQIQRLQRLGTRNALGSGNHLLRRSRCSVERIMGCSEGCHQVAGEGFAVHGGRDQERGVAGDREAG